ncbi:MAG: TIGR02452 family protein, partial [Deltaproteobacteria bacterium]
MSLVDIALETLELLERGTWTGPDGRAHDVRAAQEAAVAGTRELSPETLASWAEAPTTDPAPETRIEVTDETTQVASRRLVLDEGVDDVAVLDFASAVQPGGGFLVGAKAQEEDLCRCSGLYPCLAPQRGYYVHARVAADAVWDPAHVERAHLYTDHLLYAPLVPFFRARGTAPPDAPWLASVIVAAAPNASRALRIAPEVAPR